MTPNRPPRTIMELWPFLHRSGKWTGSSFPVNVRFWCKKGYNSYTTGFYRGYRTQAMIVVVWSYRVAADSSARGCPHCTKLRTAHYFIIRNLHLRNFRLPAQLNGQGGSNRERAYTYIWAHRMSLVIAKQQDVAFVSSLLAFLARGKLEVNWEAKCQVPSSHFQVHY